MTDTARTLAAIQALLADNNTGQISAQDLRDAIQSIATPVAGGGLEGKGIYPPDGTNIGTQEAFLTDITSTATATTSVSFVHFTTAPEAPAGWLVAGSYTSTNWSVTVPTNSSLLLPAGIYSVVYQIQVASDPGAGNRLVSWVDFTDNVTAISDHFYGSPGFNPITPDLLWPGGNGIPSTIVQNTGIIRITPAMAALGLRIGLVVRLQGATAPASLTIPFVMMWVVRIA